MTETAPHPLAAIFEKAQTDPSFRERLLADPNATLATEGVPVPPGFTVVVVEDTPTRMHLVLPPLPPTGEVSEQDLDAVAGGNWDRTLAVLDFRTLYGIPAFGSGLWHSPK
ncbi:NHLP leader peptide family RiPP precursor [Azospirillum sp.]|uniref:NHLP leader peptide family RiPP precursor n=1 Tax=Azospirillum sp. TaxID=34012 RepID=UPI003D75A673